MSQLKKSGLSDNAIGALAYLTPAPALFFLAVRRYNKRPYVRFHSWQSIVFQAFVYLFGLALKFVLPYMTFLGLRGILGLMCLAGLVVCCLWLWCVIGALTGKRCKLPIIGDWADEQAYR
ncbi:MAG: hypothetical protein ABSD59_00925 [Terracidiphilus sp.]|jgi:uncharacterized membrane protein